MSRKIDPDTPSAGVACLPCKERGHFCPAAQYMEEEPWCMDCFEGRECPRMVAVLALNATEFETIPRPAAPTARRPIAQPASDLGPTPMPSQSDLREDTLSSVKSTAPRRRQSKGPLCRHPECARHISFRSKSGACSRHWYWAKNHPAGSEVPLPESDPMPAPAAPRSAECAAYPQSAAERQEVETTAPNFLALQIQLSESQCDALYLRCTPQQKAIAIAAALQTIFAAPENDA